MYVSICSSHHYGCIYLYLYLYKLILQGFLWKSNFESQINKFLTKNICVKFGMICTTRWCNFHYSILIVLENHVYDATFWTRIETWHKPILFIFKKSQYLILEIRTIQMIVNLHKIYEKFGWMKIVDSYQNTTTKIHLASTFQKNNIFQRFYVIDMNFWIKSS